MATGLQFKENLTIISGGYRGEGVGSNGVTQNWTETQGDSGSSTVTYWYHDSAQMTDRNSTLVEVSVTDSWTAVREADNTYKVTIHSVMNFIRRTKVGSPSALSASIFVRRERGGPNIWTSGGCVNAAASATHATNVDLGTHTITLPPGQSAATHGAIYYRSNICGHDNTNPPSIYVDEYWLGVNFRNTLPPDYRPGQTWSDTGSSVQTVTGTSINVANTLQSPFEDLKVGGDTEQTTYSGKNLLPYPYTGGGNANGITFTVNSDGTIILNGQNNGNGNSSYNMYYNSGSRLNLDAGTYYFVPPSNTSVGFVLFDGTNYFDMDASNNYTRTFSTSKSFVSVYIQVRKYNTTVFNNLKVCPMLTTSAQHSEADYEPYVGGTASPNPDYPQAVQTVTGRQVVTISDGDSDSQEYEINLGKNLFDLGSNLDNYFVTVGTGTKVYTDNDKTFVTATFSENKVTFTNYVTTNWRWLSKVVPLEKNTTYTISGDWTSSLRIVGFDSLTSGTTGTLIMQVNPDARQYPPATFDSGSYNYVVVSLYPGTDSKYFDSIQIEKGSTVTTYAPYFTPIELCKIGTYQDYIYKSGEDWYLHKETAEMILDGAETITKPFTNIFVVENLSGDWPKESETVFYYCEDYYRLKSTGSNSNFDTLAADYGYAFNFTSSASGSNIRFKDTRYDNVDDYKTWLATNNVTVYYALAIPTDRQVLEPALIAQLNAIENGGSYTGTTTINVTGDLASPLTVGVRVATGSGTWQSHNRNGGWAGVYDGSTFKEMRTVNGPDGTGDPPTIKHPSDWKNQRKIGLNS